MRAYVLDIYCAYYRNRKNEFVLSSYQNDSCLQQYFTQLICLNYITLLNKIYKFLDLIQIYKLYFLIFQTYNIFAYDPNWL